MIYIDSALHMRVVEVPDGWRFALRLNIGYDSTLPIEDHLKTFDEAVASRRADLNACLQDLQAETRDA